MIIEDTSQEAMEHLAILPLAAVPTLPILIVITTLPTSFITITTAGIAVTRRSVSYTHLDVYKRQCLLVQCVCQQCTGTAADHERTGLRKGAPALTWVYHGD